jgi:hypothetical protein
MPVIEKLVRSYHVGYISMGEDHSPAEPKLSAWIQLRDEDKQHIGKLIFVDMSPLPNNIVHQDNEFDAFFNLDRFNDIINILRYEKPIGTDFDTDYKKLRIQAAQEPVGEEES